MTTAPLFAGMGGHHSARSTTDVWLTPRYVLDALGGAESFDLDPASPANRPWPTARQHYTKAENGLIRPWFGRVYLNPPYGRELARWLARMAEHDHGVSLIFARTETDAFCKYVWERASGVLFLRGRLTFCNADGQPGPGNSGAPSVLCSYGAVDLDALAACGLEGQFVALRFPRAVLAAAIAGTWSDEVLRWMASKRGPVALDDLYRAFARHPKADRNPNFRAKIRQTLQQGPYRRVRRGAWALESEAA